MQQERSNGKEFFTIIKGAALALGISVLFAVIFACVLRASSLSDKIIYPVNQALKIVAIVIGVLVFVRGEKGWLQGGVIGLLFTALSYLAFSSLGGDFSLSWLILLELAIAFLTGALSGALAVNWKK
jgi:putative membrane protein (TIGR04086 family)